MTDSNRATAIYIRPFAPGDASAFRTLNEEWITFHFSLESQDFLALNNPESYILERGGQIFMAVDRNTAIGCCALINIESRGLERAFEVSKMAVHPSYRGRGIGRKLLAHTIAEARALGAGILHLESNSKLADAIHLYESFGFRHLPPERLSPSPYARVDVYMELRF